MLLVSTSTVSKDHTTLVLEVLESENLTTMVTLKTYSTAIGTQGCQV